MWWCRMNILYSLRREPLTDFISNESLGHNLKYLEVATWNSLGELENLLSIPDQLLGDNYKYTYILSKWTTMYNLLCPTYNWQSFYFYISEFSEVIFIWIPPHRLHDERNLSAWVTDMKMKYIDEKKPHQFCKTQDNLDD